MRRKLSNNQLITLFSIVYLALILMVSVVVASRADRVETGADASFTQTATTTGICCNGGQCNNGETFGGDPNAWFSSCRLRAEAFCNAGRGGVKRDDGACTGTSPNTCNDGSLADICWKFICPFGCGGDGDNTTCNGDEPGATKQIIPCDQAALGKNECGQIDYVKNGEYCGVMDTQCNTDCIPSPTPTTTPRPTMTPPPVPPTASLTTVCTPGQSFGNLSYDLNLTKISPISGFQSATFQMCINPGTNANHRLIYQDFFIGNANWKSSATTNGVPNWACYHLATYTQITTKDASIPFKFNNGVYIGGSSANWRRTINELVQYKTYYTHLRGTTYSLKAVLKTNGQVNDSISGGTIKIQNDACAQPPTPTKTPTPTPTKTPTPTLRPTFTPTPTQGLTPTPVACNWTAPTTREQFRAHMLSNGRIVRNPDNSRDADVMYPVFNISTAQKVQFKLTHAKTAVTRESTTNTTCQQQPNEEVIVVVDKKVNGAWNQVATLKKILDNEKNNTTRTYYMSGMLYPNSNGSAAEYRLRAIWSGDGRLYPNDITPYTNFNTNAVSSLKYADTALKACQWNGSYHLTTSVCIR